MKTANDPIDSNRPFLTRLGLRIVAIISGCVAAALLAYLIMLPVMLIGIKLGPGLGSTAWGLGIFAGYIVYRQLCKRFKLTLRSKSGVDALFEKDENEVDNSASTLYEGCSEQIIDDAALTENETLSGDENVTELVPKIVEEVTMDESDLMASEDSIAEEVEISQSENDVESSRTKALDDTEMRILDTTIESDETTPNKAPTRRNSKRIKKNCIIIASIILAIGLFFVGRAIYIRVHTKAEHDQLVLNIKSKIEDGTIQHNEIEEAFSILRDCNNNNSYCNYDHFSAINELRDMYFQHLIDYCKINLEKSSFIAKDIFSWYNSSMGMSSTDFRIAVEILEYAAEQGDPRSQCMLGGYYGGKDFVYGGWNDYTMLGNDVNHEKEAFWYLQAAEQGETTAMGNVGTCYLEGRGAPINEYKGCYWIQRAANLGDSFHQRRLGDLYRDGVVVRISSSYPYHYDTIIPKDITQAMYWWNLAAEGGDETAKERLQQIYD